MAKFCRILVVFFAAITSFLTSRVNQNYVFCTLGKECPEVKKNVGFPNRKIAPITLKKRVKNEKISPPQLI